MSQVAALECLLFISGEPLAAQDLAGALQCNVEQVDQLADALNASLRERESGLHVLRIAGGYQLATRPEHAETVGRLLARGASRLSRAALEVLAIIAYRQPTTLPEIEAVRGVSSSGVLKTLQERRLIEEVGRRATLGRPILYATTKEFLHYFAMEKLEDLPPLEEARDPTATAVESEQPTARADANQGDESGETTE